MKFNLSKCAIMVLTVLSSNISYSQTSGVFGGDYAASGYANNSGTTNKWIKFGEFTLNGNYSNFVCSADFFPTNSNHGDSRHLVEIGFRNNTTGVETSYSNSLTTLSGDQMTIKDVKVVKTSGSGTSSNTFSIWIQMGTSWISSVPFEYRVKSSSTATYTINTTHQPFYTTITDTGTEYNLTDRIGKNGSKFEFSSSDAGDAILSIQSDTDNNSEGDNSRIELLQDGGSLGAYLGFNQDWGGGGGPGGEADNLFRIGTRYSNTDNFNRLVINGYNGNVGLGTSAPSEKLHISSGTDGDAILKLEADTDNSKETDNPRIEMYQDGGLIYSHMGFKEETPTTANHWQIGMGSPDGFIPYALTINPYTGSVGMGLVNPTEKLEVNGTIRSKEVKVEASPWPDYVFEPNYKLRSLEEIEKFIHSNNHLPEVPSSADVQENGIALGEMNAVLLKKIEELTLYTIEQDIQIKNLNAAKGQEPIAKSLEKKIEELMLHTISQQKQLEDQRKMIEHLIEKDKK